MVELTDELIKNAGEQWKKALGIDPYRMYADKDFQAGATWVKSLIEKKKLSK